MKQIVTVRSNTHYEQQPGAPFTLKAFMELVIVYTDGKDYTMTKTDLVSKPKLSEVRLIVSPELLTGLITDLQLHQKKLESIRSNADQINALLKHIGDGK